MSSMRSSWVPRTGAFRHWALSLIAATSVVLFASTSAVQASDPLIPSGFRLQASNGYTLTAIALDDRDGERDAIYLIMSARHAAVLYLAPAVIGPASIEADLGPIGHIDMDFVSSGEPHMERSTCDKEPVLVESGHFEGALELRGEEGYAEVHANTVRAEAKQVLNLICPGRLRSEGFGGNSPGARLTARHRGTRRFEFTAFKNSPTRPARFEASIYERKGRMLTVRGVEVAGSSKSFDFDVSTGMARLHPPEPFEGEATYLRAADKRNQWKGDLSVDFPGRANVRLTGRGTRASLIRAVQNPGQVFRLR